MNKFEKTLSQASKSIRAVRAIAVGEDVAAEQEELINELKKDLRVLQRAKMRLEDMHPDSELTLKVVNDKFDARSWVRERHRLRVEILNAQVALKLAEDDKAEWLTDLDEEEANAKTSE